MNEVLLRRVVFLPSAQSRNHLLSNYILCLGPGGLKVNLDKDNRLKVLSEADMDRMSTLVFKYFRQTLPTYELDEFITLLDNYVTVLRELAIDAKGSTFLH